MALVFLFAASAAAFAPLTPRIQRDTRRHFNFGNFGGKKVDEEAAVKEKLSHDHEMERWMGGENSLLKRKFTITTNPDYLAKAKTEIEAVAPERAPDAGAN